MAVVPEIPHEAYADAVLIELDRRLSTGDWGTEPATSLYFGGGTPSLWSPKALGRVIAGVEARLGLEPGAEVTVEANPGPEQGALAALREVGVNRLSFGTQSFQQRFIDVLGRWHTEAEAAATVRSARAAGFDAVSVDLIYATPGQTPEDAAEDGRRVIAAAPDHVSTYALTLEKVPMARAVAQGALTLPDEAVADEAEGALFEVLGAAGYARYEISSHARPGQEAVHNSLYWAGDDYLGLGCGAAGMHRTSAGARRYRNVRNPQGWMRRLAEGRSTEGESMDLTPAEVLLERVMLGLRTTVGVALEAAEADTGETLDALVPGVVEGLLAEGLVRRDGARLVPTARGLRFHDTIAGRLFG